MSSPPVIAEAPGGRRDRRGLHRAGARRGAAADRRRGRRPARLVARAGAARRPGGWRSRGSIAISTSCLSDERVGVVHVASPNAHHFEQAQAGAGIGPARDLREAAGDVVAGDGGACGRWPSRGRRRRPRSITTSATIRSATRSASGSPRGDLGRVLSVTGSYVQDWLLYPDDYNWRVEPDGRTNLRAVADIGTHWMDLAQFLIGAADPRRQRRPGHVPPAAVQARRADRHLQRLGATGRSRPAEEVEITTDDHARGPPAVRRGRAGLFHVSQVTAGRKNRLTIEIAATEGVGLLGQRVAQPALDRVAQGPQPGPGARPGAARPGRRVDQPLSGRARRGVSRHVQAALSRRLRLDRRGPAGRPAARLSRPSPTATTKSGSARRSPRAPPTGQWVDGRADRSSATLTIATQSQWSLTTAETC